MKAILEFDLDDGSDKMAHTRCLKATDAYLVLWNFSEFLRKDERPNIEEIRDLFHEFMERYDVSLNEIE